MTWRFENRPQSQIKGSRNPSRRYGAQEVRTWRAMHESGLGFDAVSILSGVPRATVHNAVTRRTWAWLDEEVER